MNLYQTFMRHIQAWTLRETIGFILLTIVMGILLLIDVRRHKFEKVQAIALFISTLYLGIVFAFTVFTRETSIRQYKVIPFWSWYEVFRNHKVRLLQENILNCMLLVPIGGLFPFISNHKFLLRHALEGGILISFCIEICQLIFMRGVFEWDDIFHNGLGCMIGCVLGDLVWKKIIKNDDDSND